MSVIDLQKGDIRGFVENPRQRDDRNRRVAEDSSKDYGLYMVVGSGLVAYTRPFAGKTNYCKPHRRDFRSGEEQLRYSMIVSFHSSTDPSVLLSRPGDALEALTPVKLFFHPLDEVKFGVMYEAIAAQRDVLLERLGAESWLLQDMVLYMLASLVKSCFPGPLKDIRGIQTLPILSHETLARYCRTSRELMTSTFSDLAQEKIIVKNGTDRGHKREIAVDVQKLLVALESAK